MPAREHLEAKYEMATLELLRQKKRKILGIIIIVLFLKNHNLESLRDEIDKIDSQVVDLLNRRVNAAAEIGKIKASMGVDPYDPGREEEVFAKIC